MLYFSEKTELFPFTSYAISFVKNLAANIRFFFFLQIKNGDFVKKTHCFNVFRIWVAAI